MVENLSNAILVNYGIFVNPSRIKEGKNGYYVARIKDGYIMAKPKNNLGGWKFLIAKG